MNRDNEQDRLVDAMLSRLPQWQPPPGFAARVASVAASQMSGTRYGWVALLLRGSALAACVSIAAWLGGELVLAGMPAVGAQGQPGAASWLLAGGALVVALQFVRRSRQLV